VVVAVTDAQAMLAAKKRLAFISSFLVLFSRQIKHWASVG